MRSASGRPTPSAETSAGPWLGYPLPPDADVYDELLVAPGSPRPHWQPFVDSLTALGPQELPRRWEHARRLLRENGVTYNVYGDPRGTDRPWELDLLPLLLPPDEWSVLEAGLAQRARLLNLILADLYGPQRLLHDGLLPPELVWAHPGFLRPCHGIPLPHACWLHLLAVDLARAPDGRWWVLADRTQVPSGAGYALENRIVLSRVLPELFRGRVQRLAGFFSTLRDTLRLVAPRRRENPRIALLTPGAYNETYFEHAYLARYLGYTLVEGADLTVRDQTLFLKTLGGLQPVDVILRRLDDDFCDPLTLRSESSLGVPGLVQAVRAGNVTVANALGSGLVETPALLPFLPGLCRALLDADLALPSVATWWCGQERELAYVLDNLDRLVIKPAFPGTGREPVFGAHLDAAGRDDLIRRMRRRPYAFMAQEQVALSTAPAWCGDHIEPRQIVLRTYLVASEDGGYQAMPGGLTRAANSRDSLVVSMQRGGGSKDTWVLSEGPVSPITLLRPAGAAVEITRGGAELPSRVADNLFWLGRYVERAEGTARLLRAILARLSDTSGESPELPTLAEALAVQTRVEPTFVLTDAQGSRRLSERGIVSFVQDESAARSLRPTLAAAQRLGAVVRDQISLDTWRVLNQMDQALPRGRLRLGSALDGLNRLILSLAAFSGLGIESMTRGQGWRFADMGRRLERGAQLASLVRCTLVTQHTALDNLLEALLEVGDVTITYRRRYLGSLQLAPVVDLLLLDETNPRSLAFQLASLDAHVRRLPRDQSLPTRSSEEKLALALLTRIRLLDVGDLCGPAQHATRPRLDEVLRSFTADLASLSDGITRSYLSHAQPSHRMGGGGR